MSVMRMLVEGVMHHINFDLSGTICGLPLKGDHPAPGVAYRVCARCDPDYAAERARSADGPFHFEPSDPALPIQYRRHGARASDDLPMDPNNRPPMWGVVSEARTPACLAARSDSKITFCGRPVVSPRDSEREGIENGETFTHPVRGHQHVIVGRVGPLPEMMPVCDACAAVYQEVGALVTSPDPRRKS